MKQSEKQRLTALTRNAVAQITCGHMKIREQAEKAAARYSPTNAASYQTLAEIVWWLIAADAGEDALRLLDTLCEVDEEYYWMFQALGSAFATRAWLHTKRKEPTAAREDAQTALRWIHRDPNPRPITETEVYGRLERFDGWLASAAREKAAITALRTLSLAMRVLVMYQQFAEAGDPVTKAVPPQEFTTRLETGVHELRQRIEGW